MSAQACTGDQQAQLILKASVAARDAEGEGGCSNFSCARLPVSLANTLISSTGAGFCFVMRGVRA